MQQSYTRSSANSSGIFLHSHITQTSYYCLNNYVNFVLAFFKMSALHLKFEFKMHLHVIIRNNRKLNVKMKDQH